MVLELRLIDVDYPHTTYELSNALELDDGIAHGQ